MNDFLKEIGTLGMSRIEFESLFILITSVVLAYILIRYQSKLLIKFFNKQLSSINGKRAANARACQQLSKLITTQGQCSSKNTKYQVISNIPGPILITDDDKNMCEVLTDIIEGQFNGFSIETANDGEEALQHIARHSPSLLILDLKMPRKTGFEVLKELSTRSEKFPILVISSDPRSKKEIMQLSHISNDRFEYLQKSFRTKELIDTIQNMLSR